MAEKLDPRWEARLGRIRKGRECQPRTIDELWDTTMRYLGKIISAVALLASAGCVSSGDVSQPLSINQLLADPSEFDGRAVVVVAYANIEFESNRLCDAPSAGREGCTWLTYLDGPFKHWEDETEQDFARYKAIEEKWRAFHGERVVVRGTFTRGPRGHFGMYPGEISRTTGVELAP